MFLLSNATLWQSQSLSSCQIVDCCVEYEKEEKLGRLLDEMATERTNKVIIGMIDCIIAYDFIKFPHK